jgi:2-keto-4-pentenoate hydratase/2-oxohepta-3-ene-1,7-dioic acid hydratase in catechol pathway
MPVYGRFEYKGSPRHAEIEGDTAHFLDDLFDARQHTGESASVTTLRVLAPVAPPKVFAVGLNYADHAKESNLEVPERPLMWFKAPSSVIAHNETVEVAYPNHRTDYEAELAIVIGKRGKGISEADASEYILGYTASQDISDRDIQWSESQWARAKSLDTYTPLGKYIHTDVNANNLSIETYVNGEVRQRSNTEQLIFKPNFLVAFLSEAITLEPGDVILTGTPYGIAPLADDDVIETRIEGMETLVNPVKFL